MAILLISAVVRNVIRCLIEAIPFSLFNVVQILYPLKIITDQAVVVALSRHQLSLVCSVYRIRSL